MSIFWPSRDERLQNLLANARSGDRDAFRMLYRELYRDVSRFVGIRIANREDAEDIVSHTFNRFLAAFDRHDPGRGTVRMFVLSIARNAVIDHVRAARGSAVPLDEIVATLAADVQSALDALVAHESAEESATIARTLVAGLPAPAREILALRYGDGLSHAEIATLLGIHVAAVKQRVSRALRDLKERRRTRGSLRPKAANDERKDAHAVACENELKPGAAIDVRA